MTIKHTSSVSPRTATEVLGRLAVRLQIECQLAGNEEKGAAMQRQILAIAMVALALVASACAGKSEGPTAMPGSYATVPVTEEQVISAARFAIDAQHEAMSAAGETVSLELVSIVAAEQQVVSGINYRLKLRVNHNGAEETADAVVWWQAWREPDPYRLTSWAWTESAGR
jgi:hypothetical protein